MNIKTLLLSIAIYTSLVLRTTLLGLAALACFLLVLAIAVWLIWTFPMYCLMYTLGAVTMKIFIGGIYD